MFRRALLAVAVLTYLICVLILSGGQKDNMGNDSLRKFLPPNLNIHVLSNESLHKKCLLNHTVDGVNNEEMLKTMLNSTSIQLLIKQLNNVSFGDFFTKNLTNKLYDINQIEDIGNKIPMTRGRRTVLQNVTDSDIKTTTVSTETVTDKEITNVKNEIPNLDNVIKFWQTLAQRNNIVADNNKKVGERKESGEKKMLITQINSNHLHKKANKLLDVVKNYIDNKERIEGGYLQDMLPEYISQQSISIQTSPTTSSSLTDDDTDIFKYLLNSKDKESLETHNINAHLSKYSYEFNYSKIKHANKNINHSRNVSENIKSNITNILLNSNENINGDELFTHKKMRDEDNVKYKVNSNYRQKDIQSPLYFINSDDLKSKSTFKPLRAKNSKHANSCEGSDYIHSVESHDKIVKIQPVKQTTSTIPLDLIKQIAEGVKALILQDLHKDVATTVSLDPTSTEGTTESTTTATEDTSEKEIEKPHILKKILDILEKYKTDEESPVKSNTHQNVTDMDLNTPKILYHNNTMRLRTNLPYLNPYYPYKSPKSKKVAKSDKGTPRLIPFIPVKSLSTSITSFVGPKAFRSKPIMLQTNLLEIPPLSIAVINPIPVVNQDLMESTVRPLRQIQHQITATNYKPQDTKLINKPERSHIGDETSRNENYKRVKNKKNGEKVQNKMKRARTISTGKNNNKKTKNFNNNSRYRTKTKDNVKRLHETQEYIQSKVDNKVNNDDCCKDEIFTEEEQQHTVDDIKTRDEASFKNLLRTQQRVTDMLALMLARTKGEQPLSVETA